MTPFWLFLALVAFVLASVVALYWRERALGAERRAEANFDALRFWQKKACDLEAEVRNWEDYFDELAADLEACDEDAPEVYMDQGPGAGPQNPAQMFNYANEMFYHRLLNWSRKHD